MKKTIIKTIIGALLVSKVSAITTVSITGANVEGFNDSDGNALDGGVLALLVVDSGNDGFGGVNISNTLATDSLLADGNDIILNIVESSAALPFLGVPNAVIAGANNGMSGALAVDLDDGTLGTGITAGDNFAVYFFPELTISSSEFTLGDTFGIATADDFVLPTAGTTNAQVITNAGNANFTVASIPEPSSTALLGLGGLALLARRRRA